MPVTIELTRPLRYTGSRPRPGRPGPRL